MFMFRISSWSGTACGNSEKLQKAGVKRNHLQYDLGCEGQENWLIFENVFDDRFLSKCEAIFCQGNGYLGVRHALEESYTGETRDTSSSSCPTIMVSACISEALVSPPR